MSSFLRHGGVILSFNQFLLSEAIRPFRISFGSNSAMDNGKIVDESPVSYTFFKHNNIYYCVFLGYRNNTDAEVGFGASKTFSLDVNNYTDSQIGGTNALKIFSQVFFVLLKIVEGNPRLKRILFSSANPKLGRVYDTVVTNKIFIDELESIDYVYDNKHLDYHIFKKL